MLLNVEHYDSRTYTVLSNAVKFLGVKWNGEYKDSEGKHYKWTFPNNADIVRKFKQLKTFLQYIEDIYCNSTTTRNSFVVIITLFKQEKEEKNGLVLV